MFKAGWTFDRAEIWETRKNGLVKRKMYQLLKNYALHLSPEWLSTIYWQPVNFPISAKRVPRIGWRQGEHEEKRISSHTKRHQSANKENILLHQTQTSYQPARHQTWSSSGELLWTWYVMDSDSDLTSWDSANPKLHWVCLGWPGQGRLPNHLLLWEPHKHVSFPTSALADSRHRVNKVNNKL